MTLKMTRRLEKMAMTMTSIKTIPLMTVGKSRLKLSNSLYVVFSEVFGWEQTKKEKCKKYEIEEKI